VPPGEKRTAAQIRRDLQRANEERERRRDPVRAGGGVEAWDAFSEAAAECARLENELAEVEAAEEERRQRPVRWSVVWAAIAAITSAVAAGAAWRTVSTSVEAYQLDQRAWLSITDFDPESSTTEGGDFSARLKILNRGNSPALAVQAKAWTAVTIGEAEMPPSIDESMPGPGSNRALLFPGDPGLPLVVKTTLCRGFVGIPELRMIVVRARVTYTDVFKREHWTEACWEARYPPGTRTAAFNVCAVGNSTDDAPSTR
jgi:hypothetical protein